MERGLDLNNPDELMHHISMILHADDEMGRRANLLAYICAEAHTVRFDYRRVLHFVEFTNAYQCLHFHSDRWTDIPPPDPVEFLEILEFSAESLRSAASDRDEWKWPSEWGRVHWNCPISNSRRGTATAEKAIARIDAAIVLHKNNCGHLQPLIPSPTETLLISELLNLFVPLDFVGDIPPLPPIVLSLDKPPQLDRVVINNDSLERWDTDGLLGEYRPGRSCEIVIYERGLRECSRQLGLAKLALKELTLIHELAHWLADQMPMRRSGSLNNHERWSDLQYKTANGRTEHLSSGFEATEKQVHEGWAQVLTFYTLLMAYDDRLRNSIAHPSLLSYAKRDGRGCLYAFLELNEHQSPTYRVWKDVLSLEKAPQQVVSTLNQLRSASPGATMSQWCSLLATL